MGLYLQYANTREINLIYLDRFGEKNCSGCQSIIKYPVEEKVQILEIRSIYRRHVADWGNTTNIDLFNAAISVMF